MTKPGPSNVRPPVAPTTEGLNIAVGASLVEHYANDSEPGKHRLYPAQAANQHSAPHDAIVPDKTTFRASEGRIWAYRGKRARVLAMLATKPDGVTQWDTYPWHTRLAASVKVMRDDGIEIETTREGPHHHARYRLLTPGTLNTQGQAG